MLLGITLQPNKNTALIGPNGAGRSTALNAINGVLPANGGAVKKVVIFFDAANIKGLRTDQLVRKGLSLVPEGRRIFARMTVWENLEMGAYIRNDKQDILSRTVPVSGRN